MLLRCWSCTKLLYTVNAFICLYCASLMYEIISQLSGNQHVCISHRPLSNQCSSNCIHTTRLHLNTSLLSWLFNSLCYSRSLALTFQLPSLCFSVLSLSYSFFRLLSCTFLCHPVISFPPSHGKVFGAGSSLALHSMTLISL